MHLNKFDLNLLVALDALMTEKHVTRAADKLHISQPAMSKALASLRDYFDDPLLQRVGGRLELTPRAEEIAPEIRNLIFQISAALKHKPGFDPSNDSRDFRLLASDYVSAVFVPFLVNRLKVVAPGIRCHVEQLDAQSLAHVDQGAADFCITVRERELIEDSESAAELSGTPLFNDIFVLLMSRTNEAAQRALSEREFLALPHVEVRFTHAVHSVFGASFYNRGIRLNRVATMPSFIGAAILTAESNLTTIVPARLARLVGPRFDLVHRLLPIDVPELRETLIWHKRTEADPAHSWFRNFILETGVEMAACPVG